MLLASEIPSWLTVSGALVPLLVLVAGLGRVLQRLDTIVTEHTAARAESKAQHEETRREIAGLREARVDSEATAKHLRADVDSLKAALTEIRADALQQTRARHDLRDEVQTIRAAVDALREDRPHAPRARGRG